MLKLRWAMAAMALPIFTGWAGAGESAPNQRLAEQVATAYRESGELRNYDVDIRTQGGKVTLAGTVESQSQRAALESLAAGIPDVTHIDNQVEIRSSVRTVANIEPSVLKPVASEEGDQHVQEPAPVTNFAGGIAPYSDSPVLPPYSWPAYTPYNNYASMAYQTQYPSGAWPFIGPPHPYPMIPSGWRRVTLKWKKGYWWMHFHAH